MGKDSECSPSQDPERFEGLTNDKLTTFEEYCKKQKVCEELVKKDKTEDKTQKKSSKKKLRPNQWWLLKRSPTRYLKKMFVRSMEKQ